MERSVLGSLAVRGGRHFCRIYALGHHERLNYVVMTYVGKSLQVHCSFLALRLSLQDLRMERDDGHFSLSTVLSVGIQCLEAIEDLHGVGYLHRLLYP